MGLYIIPQQTERINSSNFTFSSHLFILPFFSHLAGCQQCSSMHLHLVARTWCPGQSQRSTGEVQLNLTRERHGRVLSLALESRTPSLRPYTHQGCNLEHNYHETCEVQGQVLACGPVCNLRKTSEFDLLKSAKFNCRMLQAAAEFGSCPRSTILTDNRIKTIVPRPKLDCSNVALTGSYLPISLHSDQDSKPVCYRANDIRSDSKTPC